MSMTKNFTGVAVMMLVEEGKIELRRPIEALPAGVPRHSGGREPVQRPGIRAPAACIRPPCGSSWTTPRDLGDDPAGRDGRQSPALCAFRWRKPYVSTRTRICNLSRARAGATATWASPRWAAWWKSFPGEDYVHFVRDPHPGAAGYEGLASIFPPDDKKDRIALVYKHANGKLVRAGDDILAGDAAKYRQGAKYPAPEFGLYSTAPDLVKFYQMLLNGGEYNGRRYLSRQAVDTMTRVFTPNVNAVGMAGRHGLRPDVRDCESTRRNSSAALAGHVRARRRIRHRGLDGPQERSDSHHAGAGFG